jgi:CheY-like chemotaxis protein
MGNSVTVAQDGKGTRDVVEQRPFDLIFMDMRMSLNFRLLVLLLDFFAPAVPLPQRLSS